MTVRTIIITGASSGLGAALAQAYAGSGIVLGLAARRGKQLDAIAEECRVLGAEVTTAALDVTDAAAMENWLRKVDRSHPIDLVIANAGAFGGHGANRAAETADEARALIRVNLEGVTNTVIPAASVMRPRRCGHIAIVSSLAALLPHADAPGYSAAKAGAAAYGVALREFLADDGIAVSVIYPGNIDTAQTDHHKGRLPLVMTPERAAAIVKRGLDQRRATIAFPKRLALGVALLRLLPWRVRAWFNRPYRFYIDR